MQTGEALLARLGSYLPQVHSVAWGEVVLVWPWLFSFSRRLTRAERAPAGIACWPFIVVRSNDLAKMDWLLNHERIHLRQQLELMLVGAWLLQFVEVVFARLWLKKSLMQAYYWQSMEQEAYLNQHNPDYLRQRRPFAQFRWWRQRRLFRVGTAPGTLIFEDE